MYFGKIFFLVGLINFLSISLVGQSLLLNGSFEESNICSEFRAKCAPEAWFRIPASDVTINAKIIAAKGLKQEAIVVANKNHPLKYRVFLYSMLLCPLESGREYKLAFYLNPVYETNFELGILFSDTELISGIHKPLDHKPQLHISNANTVSMDKKTKWHKVEITYNAVGNEKFIIFGNFNKNPFEFTSKTRSNNKLGDLVYLIDDVIFVPKTGSFDICDEYETNKQLLLKANHRHSDRLGVFPILEDPENNIQIEND
jgi:hypothetical protein